MMCYFRSGFFSQHCKSFKCCMYQLFVYFHYCVAFNFLNILHFIYSTVGKHLGCLNLGAIIHNAAMNILVHTCMYISVGSGMVGSKAMLRFICTRFRFPKWLY